MSSNIYINNNTNNINDKNNTFLLVYIIMIIL